MRLGLRIFLVYALFIGLTGYFVLSTVMKEIRPGVRQSTEETLVDTANLLAEVLRDDVKNGTLGQSHWPELLKAYGNRQPGATIWGLPKNQVNHRIYVTDAKGIVLLDSTGEAVGQDYSKWNDVYLTLRGEYGARSTRSELDDPASSVMHVGAPIRDNGEIIGVVTVAKPNSSLQPYVDRTERRLLWYGAGLVILGLLLGALLSWWLSVALRRLTAYAEAVSEGRRAELPHYRGVKSSALSSKFPNAWRNRNGSPYTLTSAAIACSTCKPAPSMRAHWALSTSSTIAANGILTCSSRPWRCSTCARFSRRSIKCCRRALSLSILPTKRCCCSRLISPCNSSAAPRIAANGLFSSWVRVCT